MAETALSIKTKFYKPVPARLKKWTRAEYDKAVTVGLFGEDDRIELIEGEIVQKISHNPPHSRSITRATRALMPLMSATVDLAVQLPLAVSEVSESEPDLALVSTENTLSEHPKSA